MKRVALGVVALWLAGVALAAGPHAVRKRVQASMLVSGSITVAPDGTVKSDVIDHPDKLPAAVVSLIERNVPTWRFAAVVRDGRPVIAKAEMNLRIVARPIGSGNYSIGIEGANFHQRSPGQMRSAMRREPPSYPRAAIRAGVTGTVYLVLRVDRQGKVADSAVEQVNIGEIASDPELARWRRILGDASLSAARRWTFAPCDPGKEAGAPYRIARVPVTFNLHRFGDPRPGEDYGHWKAYVPGPLEPVPWLDQRMLSGGVDALPDGGVYPVAQSLRLTTPLAGT
ncbi:MAG: energy transducer TonB [Pseudomonadota bacterium]|nr:energy transducer TonB [Pseudomonadota bacterium]